MENDKTIENLYIFGASIEPMELSDGTWRWVVTGFAFEPDIYDEEGNPLDWDGFSLSGDSKEELLDPFNS